MRKGTLLFLLMLFVSAFAFGQTDTGDEAKAGNYTAKVIQLENGKFVLDVLEGATVIREKATRPFFSIRAAFLKKENALLIARWYVTELEKDRNAIYFLPPGKAREMGVTEEDLQLPNPNDN